MGRQLVVFFILLLSGENVLISSQEEARKLPKIHGISVMAPSSQINDSWVAPILNVGADWITLIPFGFCKYGDPTFFYHLKNQYWGELPKGLATMIDHAEERGLKTMLKPQVFVPDGWPGGIDFLSDKKWEIWEKGYSDYILTMAQIAENKQVDLFCFSTEMKTAIQKRPLFWKKLIQEVKKTYCGPLVYAANWDNYPNIPFWEEMEYIGVDAYFPLSNSKTPKLEQLKRALKTPIHNLAEFSQKNRKQIIFTEYGYRSIDYSAWEQWTFEHVPDSVRTNLKAQEIAVDALLEMVIDKDWFGGGFLWNWQTDHVNSGGTNNSGYSPQNKPAEEIIKKYYCDDKN